MSLSPTPKVNEGARTRHRYHQAQDLGLRWWSGPSGPSVAVFGIDFALNIGVYSPREPKGRNRRRVEGFQTLVLADLPGPPRSHDATLENEEMDCEKAGPRNRNGFESCFSRVISRNPPSPRSGIRQAVRMRGALLSGLGPSNSEIRWFGREGKAGSGSDRPSSNLVRWKGGEGELASLQPGARPVL